MSTLIDLIASQLALHRKRCIPRRAAGSIDDFSLPLSIVNLILTKALGYLREGRLRRRPSAPMTLNLKIRT